MIRARLCLILLVALAIAAPASAVPVSLELALLADVSGSVDAADFALQSTGYSAAFRDAGVIAGIVSNGPIAVSLTYWSDGQSTVVPWTLVSDAVSANAFADAIAAAARPSSGGTALAAAMRYGSGLFANNGFEGQRLVMDVSGDGAESNETSYDNPVSAACQAARAAALTTYGVTTINALWIDDRDFFGDDPEDIIDAMLYGQTNVIGGANPFEAIVDDFTEFAPAIVEKIGREITQEPIPEPLTMVAVLGGVAGLGGYIRRRRAA